MIRFKANPQKIIEAITWIARRIPGVDRYTVLKTLFYADKYHLQKYGRPVTGDVYIKMNAGPVASYAYDLIKGNGFLPKEILGLAEDAFDSTNPRGSVTAKRNVDLDFFSETDLQCMEEAAAYCLTKSFSELYNATHQEPAWVEAEMNGPMRFELLIDQDIPDREDLLEYIRETSPCQSV